MKLIEFNSVSEMEREAVVLLNEHFGMLCSDPHAVMLTGGRTPLGLYRMLEESPVVANVSLHLLISDERHVPLDSPESNYGKMRRMVDALGVDESRVLRVHTDLPIREAADGYHEELAAYLVNGGRITLGLLGLGADGHVASLFDQKDLKRGTGKYAMAVPRESGPDRVSVTRDLLLNVERLLFLVAGPEKAEIVEELVEDPESVIAGRVVRGIRDIELWYCAEAAAAAG